MNTNRNRILKPCLYFLILVSFLIIPTYILSQNEITITTYYPIPFGTYNQVRTNNLAIGQEILPNPTPGNQYVINFQGWQDPTQVLNPSPPNPIIHPAFTDAGSIYYNSYDHEFYYYNSTSWQGFGSNECYVAYGRPQGRCSTALGFLDKGDVGSFGFCYHPGFYIGVGTYFGVAEEAPCDGTVFCTSFGDFTQSSVTPTFYSSYFVYADANHPSPSMTNDFCNNGAIFQIYQHVGYARLCCR